MIERDASDRVCGMLKIEGEKNGSKSAFSEPRFFVLDTEENKLKIYYDRPENLPKTSNHPCKEIKVDYISKVSDATKVKHKPNFCFCITNSGEQLYVQAESKDEMDTWITMLNNTSKIQVPTGQSKPLAPERSRNEVAGGIVVNIHESTEGDSEITDQMLPALSLPSVMSGYATKQGAVRKNWKKRYFVLDEKGFSYYKYDQDKKPIRTIPLSEITEVKKVNRQHHPHREFLFELVTVERTFNIQCDDERECDRWVNMIQTRLPTTDMYNEALRSEATLSEYGILHSLRGVLKRRSTVDLMTRSSPGLGRQAASQEEIKPSRAVWENNSMPADRRSKTSLRDYKKGWSLW